MGSAIIRLPRARCPVSMSTFVAIDFETATHRRDSACAVGLAVSRNGRIVAIRSFLIRPPTAHFSFTEIHGLRWEDVPRCAHLRRAMADAARVDR